MHFTGKNPLNLPFYLYKSLGKMADKVQARADQLKTSLFHFSLVKFLVVEELKKSNRDWDSFLASTNIPLDPKGDTPSSAEKVASKDSSGKEKGSAEQGMGKGKEIDDSSPSQPAKKKGRRLHFVDEVEETPKVSSPITRSAAKRLHVPALHTQSVEHSTQEMDEDQVQSEEKDQVIRELQDQLKEAKHVIAQSFHDNREMKRKLAERVSDIQTPQDAIGSKKESVSKVPEGSKEKESKEKS
jgi:hypothetical protein